MRSGGAQWLDRQDGAPDLPDETGRTLTPEQLDAAVERFEDEYLRAYETETRSRYIDRDDRERAHHAAVRAGLAVVLNERSA